MPIMRLVQMMAAAGVEKAFRFTIVTTAPNETFTPPFEVSGTYDCNVNWGDGNSSDITVWNHADTIHSYAVPGTYEIAITGTIIGWCFNNGGDCALYHETKSWGPLRLGNSNGYFYGCVNHTCTATDVLDLTGTNQGASAFRDNTSLIEIPSINSWDWSAVAAAQNFFGGCTSYNQLLTFDLPANIYGMLGGATSYDQDLSGCDFTGVTSATNFLLGVTLSTANYDALILSWSAQAQTIVANFHGGSSKYTTGGAVLAAWEAWAAKGWTLQSGGENLGSELFTTNPSFETGGTGGDFNGGAEADDGTSDIFTDWESVNVNDGNGDKIEATTTKHDGTYAAKLTKTLAAHVRIGSPPGGITVTPGTTYKLLFYTRGDGSIAGRYGVYDRTNGAFIISTTSTAITGTAYAPLVAFFTVPAGCVAIDLTFRVYDAGTAYFDAMSVKAAL